MIRVGLVGLGYIGSFHADCWNQLKEAKITAVCDQKIERAVEFQEKFDVQAFDKLEDMLESGIDIIDVCLPTGLHYEVVMAALKKGISVLCEKPIALNLPEAEEMLELSKQKNVLLMIAHCVRFDPNYAFLKKAVKENIYGNLLSLRLFRNSAIPVYSESQWLLNQKLSGGVSIDLHIHDVDIVHWLLGRPEWVLTRSNNSSINTLYGYENKVVCTEASWRAQKAFPFEAGFDAQFEMATLRYNDWKLTLSTEEKTEEIAGPIDKLASSIVSSSSPYLNEISYFCNCFKQNKEPEYCSPADSLEAHRMLMLECSSAKTGQMKLF